MERRGGKKTKKRKKKKKKKKNEGVWLVFVRSTSLGLKSLEFIMLIPAPF
jgi:hypothetical protein